MTVVREPAALAALFPRVVFCAGFFDGVHAGHKALLEEAHRIASATAGTVVALSLTPHPSAVLGPGEGISLIEPDAGRRIELLEKNGAEACLMLSFTPALAAKSAEQFARDVFGPWLDGAPGRSCALVCGPNWRFGAGRSGSPETLGDITSGKLSASVVPLVKFRGEAVSSSRIRNAIRQGDFALAGAMLLRAWETRVRTLPAAMGRGVGKALGAPTANAFLEDGLQPPPGVYALDVSLDRSNDQDPALALGRAVANYGYRPTFPDARPDRPLLEIHLLHPPPVDLHSQVLRIRFLDRLRDERRFENQADLASQIRLDALAAQQAKNFSGHLADSRLD